MLYIGIDVGGTGIKAGVVSENGTILHKLSCPTLRERGPEAVIHDMARLSLQVLAESGHALEEIHSVGVGIPGMQDPRTGRIPFCTNLGWKDVPLREEMGKYFDTPFFCDNDATVAALAEAKAGRSAHVQNSVLLTLGTGLGSGIILNGRVFAGSHGVAGEIGHFIYHENGVRCTCGKRGCFERYASATALIRIGCEAALRHPESVLRDITPNQMTARTVVDAAREGDPAAVEAFDEYTTHLAMGIVSVINFLDPEMILLGGGVSAAGDFLLNPVREKVNQNKFYSTLPHGEIALAALGNDAGIIGAAMLGRQ